MYIPRKIDKGYIIKVREEDGTKRYDFQYTDRYGYTNTIGGISRLFDEEFWNYAKLISGVLRHGMPIEKTVSLIESLHLNSESINTWKTGVCRALKQYIVDGTKSKGKCPSCGQENMAYQNGCLTCMSCGYSKCGCFRKDLILSLKGWKHTFPAFFVRVRRCFCAMTCQLMVSGKEKLYYWD